MFVTLILIVEQAIGWQQLLAWGNRMNTDGVDCADLESAVHAQGVKEGSPPRKDGI
ncbi:hypothetical protein GWK36_05550 [Caldichromatium japonicum]|uniref:Uncharacterized protein n=1 Tax=Caldichromatium japonicum TaxID=2699430 RepID=A0A6G7VBY7_9GAMM|nr:hypothetical protein [Caldichromatium japonicum]QIK37531.1 hypothetical protein GWK36_05550 [Caldichromatium japonicum]